MTRLLEIASLALVLTCLPFAALAAQEGPGPGPGMPRYDLENETTLTGTIQRIDHPESPRGWQGLHLLLDVEGETLEVHVGPLWFATEQGAAFDVGETVEVTGSKGLCRGAEAFLARSVTAGESTVVLRDETGRPLWAGRGRGPAPPEE